MPNMTDHGSNICNRCSSFKQADLEMKASNSGDYQKVEKSINDLPEEVLQYIFSLIPPYRDLRYCRLVCRLWLELIEDLMKRRKGKFIKSLIGMSLAWKECGQDPWPLVAARYSHSTCLYKDNLYVFGGSTNNNTTFNDLWKFDLGTRRWIRPLVTGTYPQPKACATFVPYKDHLVLFGGWNNPPFYNFDQSVRLNNQVHLYGVVNNNWIELDTSNPPQCVAGHSATVHNDYMVVFGGHRLLINSNELWVLDLKKSTWWAPETNTPIPEPRYGQTQIFLDQNHLLIIGGYGGPNKVLSDVWLLTMGSRKDERWIWKRINIKNPGSSAPHMWSHTGCKVEDHIVFLGKYNEGKTGPKSPLGRSMKIPRQDLHWQRNTLQSHKTDNGHNIKKNEQLQISNKRCDICGCVLEDLQSSVSPAKPANVSRNTAMPSIKPNSFRNRQKQLEGCHRMEQRIRILSKSSTSQSGVDNQMNMPKELNKSLNPSVAMYLLDTNQIIENGEAEWTIVPGDDTTGSPPDSMFYSITCSTYSGNSTVAEIIVFGGIGKDSLFGSRNPNSKLLSNSVHILTYKPIVG